MKVVRSTNGVEVLVDDEDFEKISMLNWHVSRKGYAVNIVKSKGTRRELNMHRYVMGLESTDPRIVDHINGNRIDNRRSNLRICTKAQNGWNQGKQKTNKTGYKGVSKNSCCDSFCAQIRCNGVKHHLGSYPTAEEAYEVYCLAADLLHGEFANHGTGKGANHAE